MLASASQAEALLRAPGRLRLDQGFSATSYDRMAAALAFLTPAASGEPKRDNALTLELRRARMPRGGFRDKASRGDLSVEG